MPESKDRAPRILVLCCVDSKAKSNAISGTVKFFDKLIHGCWPEVNAHIFTLFWYYFYIFLLLKKKMFYLLIMQKQAFFSPINRSWEEKTNRSNKIHKYISSEKNWKYTSKVDVESETQLPLPASTGIKLPSSFKIGKPRPIDTGTMGFYHSRLVKDKNWEIIDAMKKCNNYIFFKNSSTESRFYFQLLWVLDYWYFCYKN